MAVKRAKDRESIAVVVKELGLSAQAPRNWVKAAVEDELKCAGSKVVTPKAMGLFRLRAEVARLKRENEIIKKQRRTSRGISGVFQRTCRVTSSWLL
ncbi:putative isrso8-transposase orfa protein [Collimonas fungivorans]|uniref:Putative isrso8-transposase orfa protein n=1 Tax=Collimonas fungivorans TaxID=158899 RepID=A0A127P6C0_9BURK|nr:putative isrso8-transposase orfa protein [Collimonas fungivorans]